MTLHRTGARLVLALILSSFSVASAYAAPIGGGGGGGTIDFQLLDCIKRTTTTITATPNPLPLFKSATLNWSIQVPTDCQSLLQNPLLNNAPVSMTGSQSVQPMSNTDYQLQMIAGRGVVNLGSLSLPVQLPTEVHIKGNTPDWKGLLIQALDTPHTTVYLASNVDMDLSGEIGLIINDGVSVIGGEPCGLVATQGGGGTVMQFGGTALASRTSVTAQSTTLATPASATPMARIIVPITATNICGGRTPQTFGPRLYTTSRPHSLFEIPCRWGFTSPIRLEGFRIQGPHWGPEDGADNLERGVIVDECKDVDIGNMELSGFSGSAVYIQDSDGLTAPGAVKVHDSFIHHNQHIGGDGYGVDASHGGWALIERNVFDFNRHAVTAGSVVGNVGMGGWTANYNLVLKGGGYHGKWYEKYTQQFDVHGDNNCVTGAPAFLTPGGIWNCGRSGKEYHANFNAFQYSNANSFKLRGTPSVGAFIDNNVFPRTTSDVVGTDGWGVTNLFVGPNRAPLDTFGQYGVCDFDGDGHDDLFLATGTSWWYMSSAKRQWTYLNSYTDTLDQLALGNFDGSGGCDVFAVHGNDWVISPGGRGAWQSLGSFGVPFDQLRFGHFVSSARTDIFRRAPDGQWSLVSPGVSGWIVGQSSSLPLSQLHFGDFNGDGITDVLAVQNGQWSVSPGGRAAWQPLNPSLSDSLDHVLIVDLDGKGTDDIIRYNDSSKTLEVSVAGRTGWQRLVAVNLMQIGGGVFAGHFDGSKPAQLLGIGPGGFPFIEDEALRRSFLFSRAAGAFTPYGIYAY